MTVPDELDALVGAAFTQLAADVADRVDSGAALSTLDAGDVLVDLDTEDSMWSSSSPASTERGPTLSRRIVPTLLAAAAVALVAGIALERLTDDSVSLAPDAGDLVEWRDGPTADAPIEYRRGVTGPSGAILAGELASSRPPTDDMTVLDVEQWTDAEGNRVQIMSHRGEIVTRSTRRADTRSNGSDDHAAATDLLAALGQNPDGWAAGLAIAMAFGEDPFTAPPIDEAARAQVLAALGSSSGFTITEGAADPIGRRATVIAVDDDVRGNRQIYLGEDLTNWAMAIGTVGDPASETVLLERGWLPTDQMPALTENQTWSASREAPPTTTVDENAEGGDSVDTRPSAVVEVPSVIGLRLQDAERRLSSLGFDVERSGTTADLGGRSTDELVENQSPPAGSVHTPGSTVTLTLSQVDSPSQSAVSSAPG